MLNIASVPKLDYLKHKRLKPLCDIKHSKLRSMPKDLKNFLNDQKSPLLSVQYVTETDVIAVGLSCDTLAKNECFRFKVFASDISVICITVTQVLLSSYQPFVWRSLLPIFSLWERCMFHG
jgi:hypothetical protein